MESIIKVSKLVLFTFVALTSCSSPLEYNTAIENCKNNKEYRVSKGENMGYEIDANCLIGSSLPSFELKSITGEIHTIESLLGNYTIINFWFIECPPCITELPELNDLVLKFKDEGVNFIAIGNDSEKDIESFLSEQEFNFTHVPNGRDIYRNVFKSLWGYPMTLLINKNGNIEDAITGNISVISKQPDSLFNRISQQIN